MVAQLDTSFLHRGTLRWDCMRQSRRRLKQSRKLASTLTTPTDPSTASMMVIQIDMHSTLKNNVEERYELYLAKSELGKCESLALLQGLHERRGLRYPVQGSEDC